jgi:xanthine dehydrogenase small subunit
LKLFINKQPVQVAESPNTTLLEMVRSLGLTGTKEGCASGDCGACTVMVGEMSDGQIEYRTVNACITPMAQVADRHLVTVEGLATEDQLHAVQSEMVACHGSQCGFCTPGFVMSLTALAEQAAEADRESILEGISGNLCRCTGYKPIVAAGLNAVPRGKSHLSDFKFPTEREAQVSLNNIFQPVHENELQATIQSNPKARIVAGGTDLMLELTQAYQRFDALIDISRVLELQKIETNDTHLIIGAAVTYSQLEAEHLSAPFDSLLKRLGSRQIRNTGTPGGNLANGSPIADMPPVLIAWHASLELVSVNGGLRMMEVADFYKGYRQTDLTEDEYLARIHVPLASTTGFHRFYKSSKRIEDDISSVLGAFSFTGSNGVIDSSRIAFGGMAATPVRLTGVEARLNGKQVDEDLIAEASAALPGEMTPLNDVRSSAAYRSAMASAMLERALRAFTGEQRLLVTEVAVDA